MLPIFDVEPKSRGNLLLLRTDFGMKSTPFGRECQKWITGRKFAEHRGLEDAERIDNEPPYSVSAERIKRLLYRNPSIMALLVGPFSLTILIRDV